MNCLSYTCQVRYVGCMWEFWTYTERGFRFLPLQVSSRACINICVCIMNDQDVGLIIPTTDFQREEDRMRGGGS